VEAALAQGAAELLEHGDPLERIKAGGGGGQGYKDQRSGLDGAGVPRLSSMGNDTGDDSDAAMHKGPSLLAGIRPPPVARPKGAPGKPAATAEIQRSSLSGVPTSNGAQSGTTAAKGGTGGRRTPPPGGTAAKPGGSTGPGSTPGGGESAGVVPPEVQALAELVRSKLGAMFEDCLFDVMEQLWGAFSVAGHTRSQVGGWQQRPVQDHRGSARPGSFNSLASRSMYACRALLLTSTLVIHC
jgi:hypothetical protein